MITTVSPAPAATPSKAIRVAIIGLDTSHSVEFVRRMQAPDCPVEQKVPGFHAVSCFRFETPFQNKEGLDNRARSLAEWGVKVTEDLPEALAGVDALMLEINDASHHLPLVRECVAAGLPVFLDKPLADTHAHGVEILNLVEKHRVPFASASPLRFAREVVDAAGAVPKAEQVHVYGPLGKAPAGSSVVWYGVHAFEMLQRLAGPGAETVHAIADGRGLVAVVGYPDGRRGVVELTHEAYAYGGSVRGGGKAAAFTVDMGHVYRDELVEIQKFFTTGAVPATGEDARQVLALLEATEASAQNGKPVTVTR